MTCSKFALAFLLCVLIANLGSSFPARADSTSLRYPNDGELHDAAALPLTAPGIAFQPSKDPATRFGTDEVIREIIAAAARTHKLVGGEPTVVSAISASQGGPLKRHASHQSGRDVDVLFHQLARVDAPSSPANDNVVAAASPIAPVGAFFDADGVGYDFRALDDASDDSIRLFDTARNWQFIAALIEAPRSTLQQVFVAEHLRARLLDHARRVRAKKSTVRQFAEMSCQPEYPHDDHYHLRFYCSVDDLRDGCIDSPPMLPRRIAWLAQRGITPKVEVHHAPPGERTVTFEEARAAAGPMNARVIEWLERREAWQSQPHPGRRYCK